MNIINIISLLIGYIFIFCIILYFFGEIISFIKRIWLYGNLMTTKDNDFLKEVKEKIERRIELNEFLSK